VNDSGGGSGFILPANPTGFEERDVGVTMKVNASSTALPTAVDLKLDELAIIDFSGFINYGTIINSVSYGSVGVSPQALVPTDSPFLVPIFSRRSIVSQIRMLDGETFAIGGLIAEADAIVDDKIPILGDMPIAGRFFRSEVSQKIKNNLVIFTTVRIINPDGTLKFPESQENPDSNPNETGDIITAVR
jgi:general secretion pathway protein D